MESLFNKIDEWSLSVRSHNPTCILITETWLHGGINDNMIRLDGYNIYRQDRDGQVGGGVCILIKENINGQKVYASINRNYQTVPPVQSLWIDIKVNSARFLISCIYRPDYSTEESDLIMIKSIKEACSKDMPVYIMGDFNYRHINWKNLSLNGPDRRNELFLENYLETNAHQMVTFLTRFRNSQASLLDLFLVNDKKLLYDLHGEPPLGRSDHIVIIGKTQIKCTNTSTRKVVRRNFWKADYIDINRFLVDQMCALPNLEEDKFTRCMDIFRETIDRYVPLKPVKANAGKPWLSSRIGRNRQET